MSLVRGIRKEFCVTGARDPKRILYPSLMGGNLGWESVLPTYPPSFLLTPPTHRLDLAHPMIIEKKNKKF